MNPNQLTAFKNLELGQQALKSGDKNAARQFAAQAAQLAPELEEVWLMMAALASPRGSVAYLERALQINPQSERAQKGLVWARGRLQKENEARSAAPALAVSEAQALPPKQEETARHAAIPVVEPKIEAAQPAADVTARRPVAATAEPKTQPRPAVVAVSAPVAQTTQDKQSQTRRSYSYLAVLLVLFLCVVLGWLALRGWTPAAAFLSSGDHGPAWAQVNLARSSGAAGSGQPAVVATALPAVLPAVETQPGSVPDLALPPTASLTPLPAPTDTQPVPTDTQPAPTATNIPTQTSLPTEIVLSASATPGGIAMEVASPTPLPTDTAMPYATQFVPPTPKPGVADAGGAGRWIDVDLTNQRVSAYEGNTLVNSFVVSTGTWQYPTVTGQYHVYVKFRYKDMSGPGYYLPDVPFTMFFYQGYAIHGTYWHSNFGTPMSHGCVNLTIPDSEWIYNFSSVGTLVNVHY